MTQKDTKEKTQQIVRLSMLTAVAAVLTIFPQISTAFLGGNGYVHFGDSVIYIAAFLLGPLSGAVVGGIGHALADLISGYAQYVPITFIVKGLMGFVTGCLFCGKKFTPLRVFIVAVFNLIIVLFGYYIPEYFMFGPAVAATVFISSPIQLVMSIIAFCILYPAVNKIKKYL